MIWGVSGMNEFEKIQFNGTFRDYQQRILDNSARYLKDGKINIVAAPGSGKTILGLELIRRLGNRCLILSPTTAIREQWGQRFKDLFLNDKNSFSDLFSTDLHTVRLINSITYQALYAMSEKIKQPEETVDYTDFDLLQTIKEHNIKTICLDEAHHLKNEWQKALEQFINLLTDDVKIISLTATPPYDSDDSEWARYIKICGEIDEEISVPELIAQDTLCPHQDYVYFNYPAKSEVDTLNQFKQNAISAIEQICALDFLKEVCEKLNTERDYDALYSSAKEYIALLTLFRHCGFTIRKKIIRCLTLHSGLPPYKTEHAEVAIQFLLDGTLITDEQKSIIAEILKKNSVYEKRSVQLKLNEKLKRTLISSAGKLDSITQIVKSEYATMGDTLRMLILTDYIKKETIGKIATEHIFTSVNIVSIFETLRRADNSIKIGVLSGSLIILPESADLSSVKHKKEIITGTHYCTVRLSGNNHDSVEFIGKLFERGDIQILIGTKSLLGEGWDSPCINSLILASFVGSFVLSNQMRGRAIRTDKSNPEKTANIWHLVTVEPDYLYQDTLPSRIKEYFDQDYNELKSWDFEVLKRRFDTFMGPNYSTGEIESGIERLTLIAPPYNKKGVEKINQAMLSLSAQRTAMKEKWKGEVSGGKFEVNIQTAIDKEKKVPVFTFVNFALLIFLAIIECVILSAVFWPFIDFTLPIGLVVVAAEAIIFFVFYKIIKSMILHCNPIRSIKTLALAIYTVLKECGIISDSAAVEVKEGKNYSYIYLYLRNASVHDQNIFNTAISEFLSPIENPRYILIKKNLFGGHNYTYSFACPSVIGKNKETAQTLSKKLKGNTGNFSLVYTRRENGRKLILKCRKHSYITLNQKVINKKYKVSHWE